jgi:23S rRNA (uracil1939-C5)-methyltransferase
LPVDKELRSVGMFRTASHSIVPIDNCYIQEEWCKDIIDIFNEYLKKSEVSIYDETTNKGLIRHLVVRRVNEGLLITIVVNGNDLKDSKMLVDMLKCKFVNFGLNININKTNSNIILTNDYKHIYGLQDIEVEEYGVKYSINNASFMQVNDYIKHKIYDEVLDEISPNDIVIDAYSGAGLLTAIMSQKCKFSYGIEIVKPAVDIANSLKVCNNITNMENICGDTTIELPKLVKRLKDKFIVVLDPPRKGCSKEVMETLARVKPEKIVYISCNPSTLARDLFNLNSFTDCYEIEKIKPFDMFPNTKHVETLAVLKLKK